MNFSEQIYQIQISSTGSKCGNYWIGSDFSDGLFLLNLPLHHR